MTLVTEPRRARPPEPIPPSRAATGAPARVLICDDSATIRGVLRRMLQDEPGMLVVGHAANGAEAVSALDRTEVDAMVLDIEMPVMDGLTAIPLLLRARPALKIIMASTLTTRGADVTLEALRLGAADWIAKPGAAELRQADAFRAELIAKLRALTARQAAAPTRVARTGAHPPARPPLLLAIGASTGGPQALFTLLRQLGPGLAVPIVLTQHMPPAFTATLALHLTRLGGVPCAEAVEGEALLPGHVHLAPGDRHLLVRAGARGLVASLSDGAPENFCRPAVDPMLRSAAVACGDRLLVVMLTGMGHDGLAGTRAVIEAGGRALAQDEASSVVWGMPGAIAQAELCDAVLPLGGLAAEIRRRLPEASY